MAKNHFIPKLNLLELSKVQIVQSCFAVLTHAFFFVCLVSMSCLFLKDERLTCTIPKKDLTKDVNIKMSCAFCLANVKVSNNAFLRKYVMFNCIHFYITGIMFLLH